MPQRAPHACHHSQCNRLTQTRYCDVHSNTIQPTEKRDYKSDPFRALRSTAQWKRTRLYVIQRDPVCARPGCNQPSTEADHIVRASVYVANGGNYYDANNLQGMCRPCHSSKTAREVSWAGNNKNTSE